MLKAGFRKDEIDTQISQKTLEYQGFMSKQAILYLIAKENGLEIESHDEDFMLDGKMNEIDYNDFLVSISQIIEGVQNIVIVGKIDEIFGIKDFARKDGSLGKVGTFKICDASDCIKIVLWGDQVNIIENECFQKDEFLQVIGGYSKRGLNDMLEVHLSRQGKIIFPEVKNMKLKTISQKEIQSNSSIQYAQNNVGFLKYVVGTLELKDFKEITTNKGEKSFLLKLKLYDNASSINVNIWGIKAVEYVNLLKDGDIVKITNLFIKENSYSNEKELNSTKNTLFEI